VWSASHRLQRDQFQGQHQTHGWYRPRDPVPELRPYYGPVPGCLVQPRSRPACLRVDPDPPQPPGPALRFGPSSRAFSALSERRFITRLAAPALPLTAIGTRSLRPRRPAEAPRRSRSLRGISASTVRASGGPDSARQAVGVGLPQSGLSRPPIGPAADDHADASAAPLRGSPPDNRSVGERGVVGYPVRLRA
jgi:hypothetical protein